jgi:Caspase domain
MPEGEKRVALVVGNANYMTATALDNPINDALQVTAALERLGFQVKLAKNCNVYEFQKQLREFNRGLDGSAVGLLYYSGHALQHEGENYLVPVDARLEEPDDLRRLAFKLSAQLADMRSRAHVSLVFLDACRDNPFELTEPARGGKNRNIIVPPAGLHALEKAELNEAFIAFAAEGGQTAVDGPQGGLSPFTQALIDHIETPGLDIVDLIRLVRQSVHKATNKQQTPWSEESLTNSFSFSPAVAASAPRLVAANSDPYEFVNLFDRVDESDQLSQALTDFAAPPPLKPIVMGILAETSDEYTYFVPRINSDVLRRVYPNAPWHDEYIAWAKTPAVTAEFEIRKLARKKLGSDAGKIDGLIAELGPAIAGRSIRVELRIEDFQQPEVRKKLEEFLRLWGQLGSHAPPPVLCVIFVRYRDEDISLAEAQVLADAVFERAADQLISVKPVMLSLCDPSHFEGWQYVLTEMGKTVDRLAYDALRSSFGNGTFRLRELMDRLKASQIFL